MDTNVARRAGGYYRKRRSLADDKKDDDEAINESYDTFREFYGTMQRYDSLLRGTGERFNPARTCKDLFTWMPETKDGDYWIDPNEGSSYDAFLVFCNRTSMETCVYPQTTTLELDYHGSGKDAYTWAFKDVLEEDEGIQYATDIYQMKILKELSESGRQNVTYHCKNSRAMVNLMGFGEMDHEEANSRTKPVLRHHVVSDGCKVKDNEARQSVFEVRTDRLEHLPIQDIAAYDVGSRGEEFGLEIGPVCFR